MSGDGSVLKRRLRLGTGEFPIDCPIDDTTVRVHYRLRPLEVVEGQSLQDASSSGGGVDGGWTFDSRQQGGGTPVEFDTGEMGCEGVRAAQFSCFIV